MALTDELVRKNSDHLCPLQPGDASRIHDSDRCDQTYISVDQIRTTFLLVSWSDGYTRAKAGPLADGGTDTQGKERRTRNNGYLKPSFSCKARGLL